MATNTNLGGVFTTDTDGAFSSNVYMSTENVVGIIFDTSVVGGFEKALGSGPAAKVFANGNVVELNSPKDYTEVGIDETLLSGVVKYHLDSFFSLAGGNQRLFVSFMDSDSDTEFEAIEKMQLAASGILYQIGVWTGKPIAKKNTDGTYSVEAGNVISKLQAMAELLGGKIGVTNYEGNAPLNLILNAPILNEAEIDFKKLPDVNLLESPKVSVILGQAPSDNVHKIMYAVNHVTEPASFAVVGNIGIAMGCLAVAPANESIGHVKNYNLATVMQQAELGFGSIVEDAENSCYDEAKSSFTNINTLGHIKRQDYIHKKGYIFLTNYDGLENSIFFSSDQTLSSGDYRTISRCRVMHKSRRVVRRALLPYVNEDIEVDVSTGQLSASTIASFQNIVIEALDANMVEPGTTVPQISGRTCTIDNNQDVLNTDKIDIDYRLIPRGCTSSIMVTEGFNSTSAE